MKIWLLAFLLIPSLAFAGDPDEWRVQDTILQSTVTALMLVDYGQTLTIAKHPETYRERNCILGEHPSENRVHPYFISAIIGHAIVSYMLPKEYRPIWQSLAIGIEAGAVATNYRVGIHLGF